MTLLRIALAVVLLAAVWHLADGRAALARLGAADPLWLAVAFAALHGQTMLSAWRWRLTAGALGMPMSPGHAAREYYVAQAVNQTLPGGVIGDAARAVRARGDAGLPRAAGAVVLERMAGQGALVAVLGVGLLVAMAVGSVPPSLLMPAAVIPLGAAILALAFWAMRRRPRVAPIWQGAARALLAPGLGPRQIALSFAIVALNLAAFAAAARATGTPLDPSAVLVVIPLVLFAMLLPLSIGGWGWREGAAAALFPFVGASSGAGLAASAAFGALVLAAALPGLLWLTPRAKRA